MKIAVVGSHVLSSKEIDAAIFLLDSIFCKFSTGDNVLVSGGAKGVDSIAENLASVWNWSQPSIIYKPKNRRWEPDGYAERNLLIAKECDILIAVISRNSRTRGSAWTAQRAEGLGKSVMRFYI